MKILTIFAVWLAVANGYNVPMLVPEQVEIPILAERSDINGRITNGQKAKFGQFPYQVGLALKSGIFKSSWCGGSLISSTWVLTAAHCTVKAMGVTVYLGATMRTSPKVSYDVTKSDIIVHPDFSPKTVKNDISLIRIPLTETTSQIRPVKLPAISNTYSTYTGENVVASGWGHTSDTASAASTNLNYAYFDVISNSECSKFFPSFMLKSSNICIDTPSGTSPCSGDSGGPLVLVSSGIQIGLTSFGSAEGCELDIPVVFTRITSYLDWIKNNTGISY